MRLLLCVLLVSAASARPQDYSAAEVEQKPAADEYGATEKVYGEANLHKAQEEVEASLAGDEDSPPNYVRPNHSPGIPPPTAHDSKDPMAAYGREGTLATQGQSSATDAKAELTTSSSAAVPPATTPLSAPPAEAKSYETDASGDVSSTKETNDIIPAAETTAAVPTTTVTAGPVAPEAPAKPATYETDASGDASSTNEIKDSPPKTETTAAAPSDASGDASSTNEIKDSPPKAETTAAAPTTTVTGVAPEAPGYQASNHVTEAAETEATTTATAASKDRYPTRPATEEASGEAASEHNEEGPSDETPAEENPYGGEVETEGSGSLDSTKETTEPAAPAPVATMSAPAYPSPSTAPAAPATKCNATETKEADEHKPAESVDLAPPPPAADINEYKPAASVDVVPAAPPADSDSKKPADESTANFGTDSKETAPATTTEEYKKPLDVAPPAPPHSGEIEKATLSPYSASAEETSGSTSSSSEEASGDKYPAKSSESSESSGNSEEASSPASTESEASGEIASKTNSDDGYDSKEGSGNDESSGSESDSNNEDNAKESESSGEPAAETTTTAADGAYLAASAKDSTTGSTDAPYAADLAKNVIGRSAVEETEDYADAAAEYDDEYDLNESSERPVAPKKPRKHLPMDKQADHVGKRIRKIKPKKPQRVLFNLDESTNMGTVATRIRKVKQPTTEESVDEPTRNEDLDMLKKPVRIVKKSRRIATTPKPTHFVRMGIRNVNQHHLSNSEVSKKIRKIPVQKVENNGEASKNIRKIDGEEEDMSDIPKPAPLDESETNTKAISTTRSIPSSTTTEEPTTTTTRTATTRARKIKTTTLSTPAEAESTDDRAVIELVRRVKAKRRRPSDVEGDVKAPTSTPTTTTSTSATTTTTTTVPTTTTTMEEKLDETNENVEEEEQLDESEGEKEVKDEPATTTSEPETTAKTTTTTEIPVLEPVTKRIRKVKARKDSAKLIAAPIVSEERIRTTDVKTKVPENKNAASESTIVIELPSKIQIMKQSIAAKVDLKDILESKEPKKLTEAPPSSDGTATVKPVTSTDEHEDKDSNDELVDTEESVDPEPTGTNISAEEIKVDSEESDIAPTASLELVDPEITSNAIDTANSTTTSTASTTTLPNVTTTKTPIIRGVRRMRTTTIAPKRIRGTRKIIKTNNGTVLTIGVRSGLNEPAMMAVFEETTESSQLSSPTMLRQVKTVHKTKKKVVKVVHHRAQNRDLRDLPDSGDAFGRDDETKKTGKNDVEYEKKEKKLETTTNAYVTAPGERTAGPLPLAPEASLRGQSSDYNDDDHPTIAAASTTTRPTTAENEDVLTSSTMVDSSTITTTQITTTPTSDTVPVTTLLTLLKAPEVFQSVEPSGYDEPGVPLSVTSPDLEPIKAEDAVGYDGISNDNKLSDLPQATDSVNADLKAVVKTSKAVTVAKTSTTAAPQLESSRRQKWAPYKFDCDTEIDDKGPLCQEWADGGLCEEHRPTMFLFCRKTCLCTGPHRRK